MKLLYSLLLLYWSCIEIAQAALAVNKIVVRVPKPDDIGLIFDLSVVNTQTDKKEMLEFRIRSDGTCCVNLTNNHEMGEASRIVGGNFGRIDVGAVEVVSLIWPTVSLYNRVGFCPIMITSTNLLGVETQQKHILHFDTRFTTLDPDGHTLRKRKDYQDCNNWDKEYLRNCTPVNCEERYFGQRSFYNSTSEKCEAVPRCSGRNQMYDFFANECINPDKFFTDEDILKIRQGNFVDENTQQAKLQPSIKPHLVVNVPSDGKEQDVSQSDSSHANAKRAAIAPDQQFDSLCMHTDDELVAVTDEKTAPGSDGLLPYWLKGLLDGLLIVGVILFLQVFATIAIYVLICFIIFLVVSWVTRRQSKSGAQTSCVIGTPTASADNVEVYTPSSLLSQR